MLSEFTIGRHKISPRSEPLFLPDIGTFFNQDIAAAASMVDRLVEAGVSVVKGELLHTADICLRDSGDEVYWGHVTGASRIENYRSLIERKVVPLDTYTCLFKRCLDNGLDVVVSVYDFVGADFAKASGFSAIKVASSNITHQPLIEHVAKLGLPVILDSGHSSLEEIARAIDWARDVGADKIVVEHSPLAPPNGVDQHNLRFIRTLRRAFGVPSGLSDHHAGDEMLYAAVAMGASIIEKGVRPDSLGDEQDAAHALPISQVRDVLVKIKNIHYALGTGFKSLRRDREKYRSRMGLIAKHPLAVGDRLSLETVSFAFPARGIAVEHWCEVNGSSVARPIGAGEVIYWRDLRDFSC
jgi:sialic acid synthase SpsE